MERLSLRKFEDFQIDKNGLQTVKGGMDICTGGGFQNYWEKDDNSYVLVSKETWNSDTKDSKTGSVRKHDIRMVYPN